MALPAPAGLQAPASAPDEQPAPPRFHTAANFVRVDVYPTVDGRAVHDLTQDDFDVFENGKPQTIGLHISNAAVRPGCGFVFKVGR